MHFLDLEKFILKTLKATYMPDKDLFRFDCEANHKNKAPNQAITYLKTVHGLHTKTALKTLWQIATHNKSQSETKIKKRKSHSV